MLLWDIIRDWFVTNIWGGFTSQGYNYGGSIGDIQYLDSDGNLVEDMLSSYGFGFPLGNIYNGADGGITTSYITLGDWLSTISTIIVLIALCFFFFLMVRWLFRLTAGLIQGRG